MRSEFGGVSGVDQLFGPEFAATGAVRVAGDQEGGGVDVWLYDESGYWDAGEDGREEAADAE